VTVLTEEFLLEGRWLVGPIAHFDNLLDFNYKCNNHSLSYLKKVKNKDMIN
jgi:hypothetical protein